MKISVTKIVRFETAHVLDTAYSKECTQCHGHSYILEATFSGSLNKDGMVIDLKKIKEWLQPIIEQYDHTLITSDNFGKNPTAENMAIDIMWTLAQKTNLISKIKLWETNSGYVEIERSF